MTYLAWACLCEGGSDRSYFNVLIPRVIQDVVLWGGGVLPVTVADFPAVELGVNGRDIAMVADEICRNRSAFHLLFVHADSGGRSLARTLDDRGDAYCREARRVCDWSPDRCIVVAPRHETEAWVLADPQAVLDSLGVSGTPRDHGLPTDAREAERETDPKRRLNAALRLAGRRRRPREASEIFVSVAQHQSLAALRQTDSFQAFESKLRLGLVTLGCVPPNG